jgi:hypothetical protein
MRFDFEVCFLSFLGFCDVMMKTLAINKKKIKKKMETTSSLYELPGVVHLPP